MQVFFGDWRLKLFWDANYDTPGSPYMKTRFDQMSLLLFLHLLLTKFSLLPFTSAALTGF